MRIMRLERVGSGRLWARGQGCVERRVELIAARDLMDRFHTMMRSKDPARLDPWIASAKASKLSGFAVGVEADRDAIAAAINQPWSSGQVEGKINRLS